MNLKRVIYLTYSKFVKIKNKNLPEFRKKQNRQSRNLQFFLYAEKEKENKNKNTKYTKPFIKYIFNNIYTSLQSKESVDVKLIMRHTTKRLGFKLKGDKPRIHNNRFPNYQIPNYEMIKSSNSFNNYPLHSKSLKLKKKTTKSPCYFTLGKILLPVKGAIF
jgi:hypothetical protein